jgi:hypothetical protein
VVGRSVTEDGVWRKDMKHQKIPLKKVTEYFQNLCESSDNSKDVLPYYLTKATILEGIYNDYAKIINALNKQLRNESKHNKKPVTGQRGPSAKLTGGRETLREICEDQNSLIERLREILKPSYDPATRTSDERLVDLATLMIAYKFGMPAGLTFNVLMTLDIQTLKLVYVVGLDSITLKTVVPRRIRQSLGVREGKNKQGSKTSRSVLKAFEALDAQWVDDAEKEAILVDNRQYSLNRFATELMIKEMEEIFDPKTIIKYLRKLKKEGDI